MEAREEGYAFGSFSAFSNLHFNPLDCLLCSVGRAGLLHHNLRLCQRVAGQNNEKATLDLFLFQFPHIEKKKRGGGQFFCAKHSASYCRESKVNESVVGTERQKTVS